MELINKLQKYLIEQEEPEVEEEDDDIDIFGKMMNLVCSLDVDTLDEDQYELLGDILESFGLLVPEQDGDEEEGDELEEDELFEKRIMKIKRREHLKLHKAYKKNKAKFKMMAKRFRRSAKFKMYQKRHKRMVKAGRTRKKKYV